MGKALIGLVAIVVLCGSIYYWYERSQQRAMPERTDDSMMQDDSLRQDDPMTGDSMAHDEMSSSTDMHSQDSMHEQGGAMNQ